MATFNWQDLAAIATFFSLIVAPCLMYMGGWMLNWLTDCVGRRLESVVEKSEARIVSRIDDRIAPLEVARDKHAATLETHAAKILDLEGRVKFLLRGGGQLKSTVAGD